MAKVVLVLEVEHRQGEIIERNEGALMVALRNLLLDDWDSDDYIVTKVPDFYT